MGDVCKLNCIRVPEDVPTVQQAVDLAVDGGGVLISAGYYDEETVYVSNRAVSIQCSDSETTTITARENVIVFTDSAHGSALIGCGIFGGDHPVVINADNIRVVGNRFVETGKDAISIERAAGSVIAHNLIKNTRDDCIDADGPGGDTFLKNNTCINAQDDGIEIRNFTDGVKAKVIVDGNKLIGAGEDGIQLIDYPGMSERSFEIRNNIICESAFAGIGLMDDGETREDFRAAPFAEKVLILDNTLVRNRQGISASGNVTILRNMIVGPDTGVRQK